jgi:Bacterial pre-peptidase C-terminal domain
MPTLITCSSCRFGLGSSLWLCRLAVGLFGLVIVAGTARAQQELGDNELPQPRIKTVMPCGARAGTTVEVAFAGTDIESPESLFASHPGIQAEHLGTQAAPPESNKKPTQKPEPQLFISRWKVTVAASVPLGNHDVRLVNQWGISNPRIFVVGDLNEALEKEPNNDVAEAQRVEINTTINGNLAGPTDVDYYVFAGKRGQRVVVSCVTSSIDSRLQALIELFDSTEHRLAVNRNYSGNDALLDATLPADGDYYVRVCGFAYQQGDAEHFYRLSITTAPWIDAVYPPSVELGKAAQFTVYGRNLPGGKLDPTAVVGGRVLETVTVTVDPPKDPEALTRLTFSGTIKPSMSALDGFEYRIKNESGTSNPYLLTYARAPIVLDNEKNDTPDRAQEVTLPCEIVGRIQKKRDRDWYSFTAKKGDVYTIEVFSDRIGAPTDMAFFLRHVSSKSDVGEFYDNPETLAPIKFFTRSNDPPRYRLEVKDAKAEGTYQLLIKSQDGDFHAGPRHVYRVVIAPEKPDFRLIVMPPANRRPDAGRLLKGGNEYFTALLWRQDGFNDAVAIAAEGLPAGVTCAPQTIGPGQRQAMIVVSATPTAASGVAELKFQGTAMIDGKRAVRPARAASLPWLSPRSPADERFPAPSRLDRSLMIAVRDQAPFNLTLTIDRAELKPGDKATVTVKLNRLWPDFKANVQAVALDLPLLSNRSDRPEPGITLPPITLTPGKDEFQAILEVKSTMGPGTFNLVLKGWAQVPFSKDPMAKQKPTILVVQPSTPLAVTILPK